jgi:hypothetical protein
LCLNNTKSVEDRSVWSFRSIGGVFQIPVMFSVKLILIYLTVHRLREVEALLLAIRVRGSQLVTCRIRLQRKRIEGKYNSARLVSTETIRRRIQNSFTALFEDRYDAYYLRLFLSSATPPPLPRYFIVGISVWGHYNRKQLTTELHCYNLHLSDTLPCLYVLL